MLLVIMTFVFQCGSIAISRGSSRWVTQNRETSPIVYRIGQQWGEVVAEMDMETIMSRAQLRAGAIIHGEVGQESPILLRADTWWVQGRTQS
jgi:hypothetical protein